MSFVPSPNPRERNQLEQRVHFLERENAALLEQVCGSFFAVRDEVFLKATGFNNAVEAKTEMKISGCLELFQQTSRSRQVIASQDIRAIAEELRQCMPGVEDEIKAVEEEFLSNSGRERTPQKNRGKKRVVDDEHLFLVPFLYILGGFLEWQFELLPGFHVEQQHVSELLHLSLPVVCSKWVPRYYCPRNRAWLREHCAPIEGEPKVFFFFFFFF